MSLGGQGNRRRRNIAENFNRLGRVTNVTDDRQTDGRAIAYSEREREFTFPKTRLDFLIIEIIKRYFTRICISLCLHFTTNGRSKNTHFPTPRNVSDLHTQCYFCFHNNVSKCSSLSP